MPNVQENGEDEEPEAAEVVSSALLWKRRRRVEKANEPKLTSLPISSTYQTDLILIVHGIGQVCISTLSSPADRVEDALISRR